MFPDIFNFNRERTALQAFGWYLVFFLFGAVVSGIAGGFITMGARSAAEGIRSAVVAGGRVSVLYAAGLAIATIWGRQKSFLNVSLAILGPLVAIFSGSLGGLIPVAILTTRPTSRLIVRAQPDQRA